MVLSWHVTGGTEENQYDLNKLFLMHGMPSIFSVITILKNYAITSQQNCFL
jgi:hypothetical protein